MICPVESVDPSTVPREAGTRLVVPRSASTPRRAFGAGCAGPASGSRGDALGFTAAASASWLQVAMSLMLGGFRAEADPTRASADAAARKDHLQYLMTLPLLVLKNLSFATSRGGARNRSA